VRAIYKEAFEPDERVPWAKLWRWHCQPSDEFQSVFWGLLAPAPAQDDRRLPPAESVIGLLVFGYFAQPNLGYLMYLATRPDQRGRGYGAWLFTRGLAEIERMARSKHAAPPRAAFWETRWPGDAPTDAERDRRQRRIRFYQRLGGQALPLDYTCPPIAAGQPPVRFTVMAYTYPSATAIERDLALEIALTGLIAANGATPDSLYVRNALASVDRHWPASDDGR
jgi:GNAT superfamily N-acetyltransferase